MDKVLILDNFTGELVEAVVEYEYKAEQEDELTLRVGDIITGVQTAEGGWWEGELNGRKGMFPENFVKLITRRESGAKKEEKREATQRKSVRVLAEKFKDGIPMGGVPPKKKDNKKICKVLYEYKRENDDELELAVGDLVEFHKQVEEGWWEGTLNGKHGVFPSNFVQMLDESPGSADESSPVTTQPVVEEKEKADAPKSSEEFQAIKGKKVVGVGLGNIFGGGPIKLRPTGGDKVPPKKEELTKPVKPSDAEVAPEVTKREKQNTHERAVVRFSYSAEQPDELSLVEGEIVRVIDKNLEDDGWWKGELHGKVGVFPDNFVELLPSEESIKPKKPPPPSAAAKLNLQAKHSAPNETAEVKHSKPEPVVPTIGKKPQPPPPIGKKPGSQRQEPVLPARPNPDSNSHDGNQFDDIEASGQKLTHLTQSRAKGPKKRPPSTVLTINDIEKDGDSVDPIKGKPNSQAPDRPEKPIQVFHSSKENKHPPSEPEPPSLTQPHSAGGHPPTRLSEPAAGNMASGSASNSHVNKQLEQLQRELADLKANTVSKVAFNDLKTELEQLRADFEGLKTANSKKFRELMNEVDEEKKLRVTTQVEIERVKKLVAETNV